MKKFYALFSFSLLLSQLFIFVPNSLALTNDSSNTDVSRLGVPEETEKSWLFTTMDENVQMTDAIVDSYNRQFQTKLTEYDLTQEHLNKLNKLFIQNLNGVSTGVLPNKFDLMPNLTEILAYRIGVPDMPTSIGNLTKLKSLNWNLNGIKEFPMFLNKSKTLTSLAINSGTITDIPENIHDVYSSLQVLDLRWNQLVKIPKGFFDYTWGNNMGSIALYLEGNQVTTNVPVTHQYLNLWLYNQGNNLIGNAPTDYYPQDQLINKSSAPIQLRVGDNISQITPDTSRLGLQSGRELFPNHQFVYYAEDANSLITNNIAASPGSGYIYIKSAFSEISNTYAKVKVPVVVTEENKQSIIGSDFTMYVGDKEPTADSFKASAADKDGNPVDVTADFSKVDFSKAGTYDVILNSADNQTKTVKLILKENKQSITGTDFTMYVGDKEPTVTSFKASATDKDGNPVDITADFSKVDFSKAGTYNVILNSADSQTKTVKLTIKENKQSITGTDFTMYVGDKEPTVDSFKASATDKDGKPVDVTVDLSKVDFSKAGTYEVILTTTDGQSKPVQLTIKNKALSPTIDVADKTMYVGDTLTKEDILNWATFKNADGLEQGFTVVGTPIPVSAQDKLTTKGTYKINYYVQEIKRDASKPLVQKEITLTVTEKKTSPKNPTDPVQTITNGTNPISANRVTTVPTTNTVMNNGYSGTTAGKSLPSTGEHNSPIWYVAGVALLAIVSGLFMWTKKK